MWNFKRKHGGVPSIITLDRSQSYQIKAKADFTGSRVRVIGDDANDCKKIAVFGGNKWVPVGNCGEANDHLFQQAYPVNTWGTSFVHTALEGRSSGEFVKVLALEDQTEIRVNGQSRGRINSGEQLRLDFGKNELALIETSKPASAAVLSKSGFCNEFFAASLGDPTFIIYAPNQQRIKEAYFSTGRLYGVFNLNIRCRRSAFWSTFGLSGHR